MIRLSLGLYEERGGAQLAEWSTRAENVRSSANEHGFEALTFNVPMPLLDRFRFYDLAPAKYLVLSHGGTAVWEGRVEDRAITETGLQLGAFGFWASMFDAPYTALWSDTGPTNWRILTTAEFTYATPELFKINNINELYIAAQKNEVFSNTKLGRLGFQIPNGSNRLIRGIEFDFEMNGPSTTWIAQFNTNDASWGSGTPLWSFSTASLKTGSVHLAPATPREYCQFLLVYNSVTPATYTGETGDTYVKISNLRVVTSVTNRVNTTTATTITAGSARVVTPANMAGIHIGQRLFIDGGLIPSESVIVTDVTATTFTADFVNGYSGSTKVQAHVVYADEIIEDLISHISGINPSQLSTSTALVESPGIDLLDELYEDALPGDIAVELAALGDNATPPQRYEVGVFDGQTLFFRPRGSAARAWYVDLAQPVINSTMNSLVNSVYATYQDANNRTLRTATNDDDESISRYGITRRALVPVRTTSATQAGIHRDARLADGAIITPEGQIITRRLYDASGAQYPVWLARPGDTVTARNLPPIASAEIDKIRTFTVARFDFDANQNQATITPEQPLPQLEFLIARESV